MRLSAHSVGVSFFSVLAGMTIVPCEAGAGATGVKPSLVSEVRLVQMGRMTGPNSDGAQDHSGSGVHGASQERESHSDDTLSFSGQLNLIFDTKDFSIAGDKVARGHFNLEFSNALDLDGADHSSGDLTVKDAFVEILLTDALNVRAGQMLTDFGIYNRIHDYGVTFVRDVPPLMYNPQILEMTIGDDHFVPEFSSFSLLGRFELLSGLEYSLYLGNGLAGDDGTDVNRDKLFGGRALLELTEDVAVGVSSAYSDDSAESAVQRLSWFGADLQVKRGGFGLNAEMAQRTEESAVGAAGTEKTRALSWYTETWYEKDLASLSLAPFVGYDVIDPDTDVGHDTSDRVSAGVNVILSPELRLKLAHHWHTSKEPSDGSSHSFEMITVVLNFMAF